MNSILKKFWKRILCVLSFFFGTWFFNHFSAWIGIFICVVSVILFCENVIKNLNQINVIKNDEKV